MTDPHALIDVALATIRSALAQIVLDAYEAGRRSVEPFANEPTPTVSDSELAQRMRDQSQGR